jgi:hypothetical protein
MMDLATVEQRLSAVSCPVCKTSTDFMIPRDSRVTDGEYKAFCKGCRYSFPVHLDVEGFTRSQPDVAYWLKGMRCPACLMMGARLDFRVQPSVRGAWYFVTCAACGNPFAEKSSLEAFE